VLPCGNRKIACNEFSSGALHLKGASLAHRGSAEAIGGSCPRLTFSRPLSTASKPGRRAPALAVAPCAGPAWRRCLIPRHRSHCP